MIIYYVLVLVQFIMSTWIILNRNSINVKPFLYFTKTHFHVDDEQTTFIVGALSKSGADRNSSECVSQRKTYAYIRGRGGKHRQTPVSEKSHWLSRKWEFHFWLVSKFLAFQFDARGQEILGAISHWIFVFRSRRVSAPWYIIDRDDVRSSWSRGSGDIYVSDRSCLCFDTSTYGVDQYTCEFIQV
jgi:hypothetical protein